MNSKLKLILIPVLLVNSCMHSSSDQHNNLNTSISFDENSYDFGSLKMDARVSHDFRIYNAGKHALLIQNISTSCGCTVPEWPKEPIKKGESKPINVTFEADHPGVFRKSIIVFYNGLNSPDTLIIKGTVTYPENL